MKLWHDDIRPAPEGWVWARTNEEAQEYLLTGEVTEISMDHDLGYHDVVLPDNPDELAEVMFLKGQSEQNGEELAVWMCQEEIFPSKITIHSWNPDGARRMAQWFMSAGVQRIYISPFKL